MRLAFQARITFNVSIDSFISADIRGSFTHTSSAHQPPWVRKIASSLHNKNKCNWCAAFVHLVLSAARDWWANALKKTLNAETRINFIRIRYDIWNFLPIIYKYTMFCFKHLIYWLIVLIFVHLRRLFDASITMRLLFSHKLWFLRSLLICLLAFISVCIYILLISLLFTAHLWCNA